MWLFWFCVEFVLICGGVLFRWTGTSEWRSLRMSRRLLRTRFASPVRVGRVTASPMRWLFFRYFVSSVILKMNACVLIQFLPWLRWRIGMSTVMNWCRYEFFFGNIWYFIHLIATSKMQILSNLLAFIEKNWIMNLFFWRENYWLIFCFFWFTYLLSINYVICGGLRFFLKKISVGILWLQWGQFINAIVYLFLWNRRKD